MQIWKHKQHKHRNQSGTNHNQSVNQGRTAPITVAATSAVTAHSAGWRHRGLCRMSLAASSVLYWSWGMGDGTLLTPLCPNNGTPLRRNHNPWPGAVPGLCPHSSCSWYTANRYTANSYTASRYTAPCVGKPLFQARESSLVPLCLHPVQFMHKTQIYEAFVNVQYRKYRVSFLSVHPPYSHPKFNKQKLSC